MASLRQAAGQVALAGGELMSLPQASVPNVEVPSVLAGRLPLDQQLYHFRAALDQNRTLGAVLEKACLLGLPGWYLAAGALCQTVWNLVSGFTPDAGIRDYDLIYFDGADLSWDAEDAVIRAARGLFADLPADVEIRNQARVHLWYEDKFGRPCQPFDCTEAAIDTFPATATCVGVRSAADGHCSVYAPFGLSDMFSMVVRPNTTLCPQRVYEAKATRWKERWPALSVLPWPTAAQ
jgi:uncharacterized protein